MADSSIVRAGLIADQFRINVDQMIMDKLGRLKRGSYREKILEEFAECSMVLRILDKRGFSYERYANDRFGSITDYMATYPIGEDLEIAYLAVLMQAELYTEMIEFALTKTERNKVRPKEGDFTSFNNPSIKALVPDFISYCLKI